MYNNNQSTYIHNTFSGTGATEIQPSRAPQIEMELMELQASLDALLDKIGNLSNRLAPVLRESQPNNDSEKMVNVPLVPLADNIRRNRWKVSQAHHLLDDLMERLEI